MLALLGGDQWETSTTVGPWMMAGDLSLTLPLSWGLATWSPMPKGADHLRRAVPLKPARYPATTGLLTTLPYVPSLHSGKGHTL